MCNPSSDPPLQAKPTKATNAEEEDDENPGWPSSPQRYRPLQETVEARIADNESVDLYEGRSKEVTTQMMLIWSLP